MKITIKNLKVSQFASEETLCFEATVYIDGLKSGTVSNSGCGGSNEYHPWEMARRINEYAKTLPMIETDMKDPHDSTKMFTYAQDADGLIDTIVEQMQLEKDFDKRIKTRLLFDTPKGITQTKANKAELIAAHIAKPDKAAELLAQRCLNLMPRAEALAIFAAKG